MYWKVDENQSPVEREEKDRNNDDDLLKIDRLKANRCRHDARRGRRDEDVDANPW